MMDKSLENILSDRLRKNELVSFIKKHPELFNQVIEASLGNEQPVAWRSAWLIFHYMKSNDERLRPHINSILSALPGKCDGHQRELLKILNRMELDEKQEGVLFDICVTIWEEIDKSSSVRGTAFQTILSIVNKYPELKGEIEHLMQPHYIDSLSPGIKNSFYRLINEEKP